MSNNAAQLDVVNRSGYPLQIALAEAVRSDYETHYWKVLYEEHAWRSSEGEGFIDLVLEQDNLQAVLVIECGSKTRNGSSFHKTAMHRIDGSRERCGSSATRAGI